MRPDVALDVRETSHTSAGMLAYLRALRSLMPYAALDLRLVEFGAGDNFDFAEQVGMPVSLLRLRPRLVHFPTPFVPRLVPVPHVVTVHDLIDLEFPRYAKRKVGPYWRRVVGPVLRSARAVITDDEATVPLLERFLKVPPGLVRVIPLGVDAPYPLPEPTLRARPYFFYAGNHRPHKDLATLVRAWAGLPKKLAVDLIVTGEPSAALPPARRTLGELVFAGNVSESELFALYRGALAYVHPALREGFGLPMLEAMRVATPVIAADSAVPAILRPHAITFPAGDAAALGDLLLTAAADGFGTLPERARTATAELTWERTVRATADVYRELLT